MSVSHLIYQTRSDRNGFQYWIQFLLQVIRSMLVGSLLPYGDKMLSHQTKNGSSRPMHALGGSVWIQWQQLITGPVHTLLYRLQTFVLNLGGFIHGFAILRSYHLGFMHTILHRTVMPWLRWATDFTCCIAYDSPFQRSLHRVNRHGRTLASTWAYKYGE